MFHFFMQDHVFVGLRKKKDFFIILWFTYISAVCLLSAGPHHISTVRQHMGHKVIEKWDWGVTSCWSKNMVQQLLGKPSGFGLYHTFPNALKYLTLLVVFQLCTGNVWNVKSESRRGLKQLMDVKYFSYSREVRSEGGAGISHHHMSRAVLMLQLSSDYLFLGQIDTSVTGNHN